MDGRDKWLRTSGSEIQSASSMTDHQPAKCLAFDSYYDDTRRGGYVRVKDCATARAMLGGASQWRMNTKGQLVNGYSDLCLEINPGEAGTAISGGCEDIGDVTDPSTQGGGCLDVWDCDEAEAIGDGRDVWAFAPACAPSASQCGGGGMSPDAPCCNPAESCVELPPYDPEYWRQCGNGNTTTA
eukprot:CAMPEP_0115835296 /NCGR_PEP_ID=MMETSP0287-20121206/4122_1 /TAXON_ID=412157 /ORGANISM="Chrysochromulina rotalis, Strain UIO044" /LENGTH=183 /DNA_ID=CAMNT_0003288751 /DNA_START=39 /DNA_END=590 /DNA_ORIENTATION=+